MKRVLPLTPLIFAILLIAARVSAREESQYPQIDLSQMPAFMQQSIAAPTTTIQTPTVPAPTKFTVDDSFDTISTQIEEETREANAPSQFVNYTASNELGYQKQQVSSGPGSGGRSSAVSLMNLITKLPYSETAHGWRVYLSIVKPDLIGQFAAQSNNGVRTYLSDEMASNPCLRNRAIDFYTRIGKTLSAVPAIGRPTIFDSVKRDTNGQQKPGWIWKTALQSSGGDSGLALTLIGLCGHDDHNQSESGGEYSFRDDSEVARRAVTDQAERLAQVKADLVQKIHGKPTVKSKALLSSIDQKIAALKSTHGFTTITCPTMNSAYFAPGSLGADVDIPRDLKNEINATQNPDGVLTIPAKYYHEYLGAYAACKMIEEGVKPDLAKSIAKEGAKMYRAFHLCESLSNDVVYNVPGYHTAEEFLESPDASHKCHQPDFQHANANVCQFAAKATFYRQQIKDPTELRKKIDAMFVTADASYLYRLWFVGEKFLGRDIPCTMDHRRLGGFAGPHDLMKNDSKADPNDNGFNYRTPRKPLAWTNARYENAKRKIATWVVDSKWTVAQHEAGAEFASKVCKPRPSNENQDQAACRIDAGKPRASTKAIK